MIKKRAMVGKSTDRYDICDQCSHKFFLKQLYDENLAKETEKDALIDSLQTQLNEKKAEFKKVREEHNNKKKEVFCI